MNGPYANSIYVLGLLLGPIGLFFLIAPVFINEFETLDIGIVCLVAGLLISLTYSGVTISFNERKIREYYSYCGFKRGEWVGLPEQIVVQLRSDSYVSTNTANGISPTLSGKVQEYITSLYQADDEKPIVSFRYTGKQEALKEAGLLAEQLGAGLEIHLDRY